MKCTHCGAQNIRLIKKMTNVSKYFCRRCRKTCFEPIQEPTATTLRDCMGNNLTNGQRGYMVFNHQNKAGKIIDALNENNFVRMDCVGIYKGIDLVFSDTDILGRRNHLEKIKAGGVSKFFVYPHAARPDLVNDIYPAWPHTTAHLVVSEGHAEIMRRFGYPRPTIAIGWSLCPIKKFRPRKYPRKVLFAPIHPRCSKVDQDVNRATFMRLKKLAVADDIELTVRFIRSLGESGLEKVDHPNITYTTGTMNQGYDQIDQADLVIAHQTFAWLSVARGTPTIMMAEDMPTHVQVKNRPVLWAKNWKKYEDLLMYPYDILGTKDPLKLMQTAVSTDKDIAAWRKRLIGQPFNKRRFIEKLKNHL